MAELLQWIQAPVTGLRARPIRNGCTSARTAMMDFYLMVTMYTLKHFLALGAVHQQHVIMMWMISGRAENAIFTGIMRLILFRMGSTYFREV
jgi:hypothetical protein